MIRRAPIDVRTIAAHPAVVSALGSSSVRFTARRLIEWPLLYDVLDHFDPGEMGDELPDGARIAAGIVRAFIEFGPLTQEGENVQHVIAFFLAVLHKDLVLLEAIDVLPDGAGPGSPRATAVAGRLSSLLYEMAMLSSPAVMRHREAAAAPVRISPAAAAAAAGAGDLFLVSELMIR